MDEASINIMFEQEIERISFNSKNSKIDIIYTKKLKCFQVLLTTWH